MKKILIMAGALVLSTTAFADLKSTITNQYKNNELEWIDFIQHLDK